MLRSHIILMIFFGLFTPLLQAQSINQLVQDGDVVFQVSRSSQSLAIQKATHSRYSHMGLILFKQKQPYVYEASSTVRYTPLTEWIARGQDQHIVVKRLKNAQQRLTPTALKTLHQQADRYAGRPYDLTFAWSDQRMYCSELVWKIYAHTLQLHLGELQQLKDFDLSHPAVKAKLQERYGNAIPLHEQVISPVAMFESEQLETIFTQ